MLNFELKSIQIITEFNPEILSIPSDKPDLCFNMKCWGSR